MRKCPDTQKAKQLGCMDLKEGGVCLRRAWTDVAYLKTKPPVEALSHRLYCERVSAALREE